MVDEFWPSPTGGNPLNIRIVIFSKWTWSFLGRCKGMWHDGRAWLFLLLKVNIVFLQGGGLVSLLVDKVLCHFAAIKRHSNVILLQDTAKVFDSFITGVIQVLFHTIILFKNGFYKFRAYFFIMQHPLNYECVRLDNKSLEPSQIATCRKSFQFLVLSLMIIASNCIQIIKYDLHWQPWRMQRDAHKVWSFKHKSSLCGQSFRYILFNYS